MTTTPKMIGLLLQDGPASGPPAPRRWPGPAAAVLPALPPPAPRKALPPPAVLTAADPPAVGAAKAGYNRQLARAQAAGKSPVWPPLAQAIAALRRAEDGARQQPQTRRGRG
ncbi:MAG TPA: hypothetical protein VKY74_08080 [Chloroflexia bacterium]|nr:hypothetical protein [Chloroflexia bacterium]